MNVTRRLSVSLLGLLLAAPAAAEQGSWWEMTSTMEMPGMPFAMPPTKVKFCQPEGPPREPPDAKPDPNCKMTDMRTSGNTMKWKVVCTGKNKMEGEGEMTSTPTTMDGVTRIKMDGRNMTMKMHGKKVGPACDPEAERKAMEAKVDKFKEQAKDQEAKVAAARAKACDDAVNEVNPQAVAGTMPSCPPERRQDFCAKARTEEGLVKLQRYAAYEKSSQGGYPGPKAAAKACGYDEAALFKEYCPSAEKRGKLDFLASSCPAEAKALGKRECAGRDYTALQGSKYRDFCALLKGEQLQEPEPATGTAGPAKGKKGKAAPAEEEDDEPQDKEAAAEKGKKLLKGVLGF